MEILSKANFDLITKKYNKFLIVFCLLILLTICAYIFSFGTGKLYISIIVGIASVIVCSVFYFLFIFENSRILKLFKNAKKGINQEEEYFFVKYDGKTERDGVKLNRIIAKYYDGNEEFERTLYSLEMFPFPELKEQNKYIFITYQNIIAAVKE